MCDLKSHIGAEYQALRGELAHLKDCQVRYFWSSVTVTGVLVGLGSRANTDHPTALPYLAPLLIVLPCWLIFFDKATTITRIIGYTRVLEAIRINLANPQYEYVGWENALRIFRKDTRHAGDGDGFGGNIWSAVLAIPLIFFRGAHHRYWSINWLTFFLLCVVCLFIGTLQSSTATDYALVIGSFLGTAFVSIHNLALLKKLTTGKYSYDINEAEWRKLLEKPQRRILSNPNPNIAASHETL